MTDPTKWTKTEDRSIYRVHEALSKLEFDLHMGHRWHTHVPLEWADLHRNRTKVKVTTRLDTDIVKYLKSLGPGYQQRINAVLRAWVEMKATHMIDGEATIVRDRTAHFAKHGRPVWADLDGTIGQDDPPGG